MPATAVMPAAAWFLRSASVEAHMYSSDEIEHATDPTDPDAALRDEVAEELLVAELVPVMV